MAAKNVKSLTIAEIEKNIARVTAELQQARKQKVKDAEQSLAQAKAAVIAATTKVNQLAAAGASTAAGKNQLQKAQTDLAKQQQAVTAAEEHLADAKTALEIAVASAREAVKARPGQPVRATKKAEEPKKAATKKPETRKTDAKKTEAKKTEPQKTETKRTATKKPAAVKQTTTKPKAADAATTTASGKRTKKAATHATEAASADQPAKKTGKSAADMSDQAARAEKRARAEKALRSEKPPRTKKAAPSKTADVAATKVPEARPSATLATRKAMADNEPAAMQTALEFEQPGDQTAAEPAELQSERLPKPLPVDQDDVGYTTHASHPAEGAATSGHASMNIIEPRDNPLPKPEPV